MILSHILLYIYTNTKIISLHKTCAQILLYFVDVRMIITHHVDETQSEQNERESGWFSRSY